MTLTFEWLLIYTLVIVVVVQQFYIFRSTPPAALKLFLDVLGEGAKKTETPLDDEAVNIGKQIIDALAQRTASGQSSTVKQETSTTVVTKPADTRPLPPLPDTPTLT